MSETGFADSSAADRFPPYVESTEGQVPRVSSPEAARMGSIVCWLGVRRLLVAKNATLEKEGAIDGACNHPDRVQITFDECRLVANARLPLPATRAAQCALSSSRQTSLGEASCAGEQRASMMHRL